MRTTEEIRQEFYVSDLLLEIIMDQSKNDLYNNLTTSDLQGYCGAKAITIIKTIKELS